MPLSESIQEIIQTVGIVGLLGFGVVSQFIGKGYIDLQKTMIAANSAIDRVRLLIEDGHIENISDAILEAVGIVCSARKKNKLSKKERHKIEERVRTELGHLLGDKEPKHIK